MAIVGDETISNELASYEPRFDDYDGFGEETPMSVTAFVGGDTGGNAVQFTLGRKFVRLTDDQVADLIAVLAKRLALTDGYAATHTNMEARNV